MAWSRMPHSNNLKQRDKQSLKGIFFNAVHAPIGAHASFTLGARGRSGGLGLELGEPSLENIIIGLESRDRRCVEALPFMEPEQDDALKFDHEGVTFKWTPIEFFKDRAIRRVYHPGSDQWTAGDLCFTIHSQIAPAPDPLQSTDQEQKLAYCPAVIATIRVDNRQSDQPRRAIFGFRNERDPDNMRAIAEEGLVGVAAGQSRGFFCRHPGAVPARGFTFDWILSQTQPENLRQELGRNGALLLHVPAGKVETFTVAVCFYRGGQVTTGLATSYWYARYFSGLEAVACYAIAHAGSIKARSGEVHKLITQAGLNPAQEFQMIHAVQTYYASTQLLDCHGQPLWVVNEGEYRMMNTLDLTIDQAFYELKLNPWTVGNVLDFFASRYQYSDRLDTPAKPAGAAGGIAFTHDMGCRNHFSRPGYSTYERGGLTACFSYMSYEQLVNWTLCAVLYLHESGDEKWMETKIPVMKMSLTSLMRRDHPKSNERNGVMGFNGARTLGGREITTYDSLDASLGQACGNLYLAVKTWAAYLALRDVFLSYGFKAEATKADRQAVLAAASVVSSLKPDGSLPAIIGEDIPARIIPAIEGLVFPYVLGQYDELDEKGRFRAFIGALKSHLSAILKPGICLYPDGGWKLSSSRDNSWLSKIYLCQFVAREILDIRSGTVGPASDDAHMAWLLNDKNLSMAWSDQMRSGIAVGSRCYPRGVTSILWLRESRK
jgi:xylan 1,4-beta-xylosidase